MYAVVSTGGKQLKVEKGTEAVVEKLDAAVGEIVTFDVLFAADGDTIVTGADASAAASVTAEVVEHFKGDKAVVFKFKRRKGYKRLKGHRQLQTRVVITDVSMSASVKKAAAQDKVVDSAIAFESKVDAPEKVSKSESDSPKKASEAKVTAKAEEATVAVEPAERCCATKSNGDPCTNKPKEGSRYCGVHAKKFEE